MSQAEQCMKLFPDHYCLADPVSLLNQLTLVRYKFVVPPVHPHLDPVDHGAAAVEGERDVHGPVEYRNCLRQQFSPKSVSVFPMPNSGDSHKFVYRLKLYVV